MPDNVPVTNTSQDLIDELRLRAETLERRLAEVEQRSEGRLIRSELKAEAIRAGMVDLDGLKLIDLSEVKLGAEGEIDGAPVIMARIKKIKPWLFGGSSFSSSATPPPVQAPRQKLATEMTDAEYRTAREAIVKYRG
jgi:hypothetical protein